MWNKLTVAEFIQLQDIDSNQRLNVIEKQQMMLALLEGKEIEEYDNIKYTDMLALFSERTKFFEELPSEVKPVDIIEVNGKRYKFNFELTEITAGQYIDISGMGGNMMELNKIAACFFLPMKGKRYLEYGAVPHEVVAEELLDAKFIDVYSAMVFFCELYKELIGNMLTYSKMTEQAKDNLHRLWRDGVGYLIPSKLQTTRI